MRCLAWISSQPVQSEWAHCLQFKALDPYFNFFKFNRKNSALFGSGWDHDDFKSGRSLAIFFSVYWFLGLLILVLLVLLCWKFSSIFWNSEANLENHDVMIKHVGKYTRTWQLSSFNKIQIFTKFYFYDHFSTVVKRLQRRVMN